MKHLILVLGIVLSFGFNNKAVGASSLDLSSGALDEGDSVYVIPIVEDMYSFYEARGAVGFAGTANHQRDITSGDLDMLGDYIDVYFDYVSPQKYNVGFNFAIQRNTGANGWVDVVSNNFTATSSTKTYNSRHYFSNKQGPFRVLIRTDEAFGVKITNGKVTY